MAALDPALTSFTLLSIAAALYLPIIFFAILRREGQEITAGLIILYALIGMGLGIFEAFWRGGSLSQMDALAFGDIEVYGALTLAFLDDDHGACFHAAFADGLAGCRRSCRHRAGDSFESGNAIPAYHLVERRSHPDQ